MNKQLQKLILKTERDIYTSLSCVLVREILIKGYSDCQVKLGKFIDHCQITMPFNNIRTIFYFNRFT